MNSTVFKSLFAATLFSGSLQLFALSNTGVDAGMLPQGIGFFRERLFTVHYERIWSEEFDEYLDFDDGEHFENQWYLSELAYGVTPKLTLVANLWYYNPDYFVDGECSSSARIGDFYIFSKYRLWSDENDPRNGICLLNGLRFSSGDHEEHPDVRFGDGSTDIGIGFCATKWFGPVGQSFFIGFWEDVGGEDVPYEIDIRATTEFEIVEKKWVAQLELKGYYFEGKEEYTFEVVPGIQYIPIFPVTLQFSAKIPFNQKGYYEYDVQYVFGISTAF